MFMESVSSALMAISSMTMVSHLTHQEALEKANRHLEAVYAQALTAEEKGHLSKAKAGVLQQVFALAKKGEIAVEDLHVVIKNGLSKILFQDSCVLNPLPLIFGVLRPEHLLRVMYITTAKQTNGWTCGYRAIFNACALAEAVRDPQTARLANHAMLARAHSFYESDPTLVRYMTYINEQRGPIEPGFIADSGVNAETEHLRVLSQMPEFYGGHNLYFVGFDVQSAIKFDLVHPLVRELAQRGIYDPQAIQEALEEHVVNQFNQHVNANSAGVLNFVCHINRPAAHWLLISVIKLKDKQPFLLILDSYNFKVDESVDAESLIRYFYNLFIERE